MENKIRGNQGTSDGPSISLFGADGSVMRGGKAKRRSGGGTKRGRGSKDEKKLLGLDKNFLISGGNSARHL